MTARVTFPTTVTLKVEYRLEFIAFSDSENGLTVEQRREIKRVALEKAMAKLQQTDFRLCEGDVDVRIEGLS